MVADPADPPPQAADPTIVGLWNVQFVADGQVIDAGFDAWHADGTETLKRYDSAIRGRGVRRRVDKDRWADLQTQAPLVALIRETITVDREDDPNRSAYRDSRRGRRCPEAAAWRGHSGRLRAQSARCHV
jgi:hypothetical protein